MRSSQGGWGLAPSSKILCVLCASRHSRSLGLPTSPWVVGALKGRLRASALKTPAQRSGVGDFLKTTWNGVDFSDGR